MTTRLTTFAALLLLAAGAAAQSISGIGGMSVSDDRVRRHSVPDPVAASGELRMRSLQITVSPPKMYLNVGTDRRFGPYALSDGTEIGVAQPPYKLTAVRNGSFSVLGPDQTVYGPFSSADGTAITIGRQSAVVLRPTVDLAVRLEWNGMKRQKPVIGIAVANQPLYQALYELRDHFATVINRVNYETADREIQGMPRRIHYPNGRNNAGNVVSVSKRDKENSEWQAERSCINAVERLFNQRFHIKSYALTDRFTSHFRMPAGRYLLCAMQRYSDPKQSSTFAGSKTAIWWTEFTFDGQSGLSLDLTPENAISWREIFPFQTISE